MQLQHEDLGGMFGGMQQPSFDDADLDEDTRESLRLAWQLQEEERTRVAEQRAAEERLQNEPEDAESIALAIRLQQEDDEQALRNALGVNGTDSEPGSPSSYSYEQLMRLGQTIGEVSKGASEDQINALRTITFAEAQKDSSIILGEQARATRWIPFRWLNARAACLRTPCLGRRCAVPHAPLPCVRHAPRFRMPDMPHA